MKKSFWKNIHFCTVVVWCAVNQMLMHFSEATIPPGVFSSMYSTFTSNHPGAKSLVRHGIESISSPNHAAGMTPTLRSLSNAPPPRPLHHAWDLLPLPPILLIITYIASLCTQMDICELLKSQCQENCWQCATISLYYILYVKREVQ